MREYPAHQARAVIVLNPTETPHAQRLPLPDLVGWPAAHVFEWSHTGATPLGRLEYLLAELPAHSARLYFISDTDTPPPAGLTIGGAMNLP